MDISAAQTTSTSFNHKATTSKAATIDGWVFAVLLSLAILGSAFGKLSGSMAPMFVAHLQLPLWKIYLTGAVEMLGAVMLLVPRTQWFGALWIGGTVIGAIVTHLRLGQVAEIGAPVMPGLFALIVAVLRRDHIVAAFNR